MIGKKTQLVFFSVIILIFAYFTYFRNYWQPANLFWDENYHITAAQKYLSQTFFMGDHPPLGKMFIALGEYIFNPNQKLDTRSFLSADYIKDVPKGYSFVGVRFFPALFAALSSLLFFFILYLLSGRVFLSFLFTSFYLFENAIIVHSRGAMLESVQIFFVLLLLLTLVKYINKVNKIQSFRAEGEKSRSEGPHLNHTRFARFLTSKLTVRNDSMIVLSIYPYLILGLFYGLAMSVKLNSASLGLSLLILLLWEYHAESHYKKIIWLAVSKSVAFLATAFLIFSTIYYIHFSIARTPVQNRYYEASESYKNIIVKRQTANIKQFPLMFFQHIRYIFHYEKGVPVYDVCKPGENGSLPVTWPFGNKTINYRWENNGGAVKYLYLQGNPAIWFLGILGIFFAVNLVVSYLFFGLKIQNKKLVFLITSYLLLYVSYMAIVMSLTRVMYLYHYFIPLIFSMILCFLMFLYFFEEGLKKKYIMVITVITIIIVITVITYFFFSPLTYYKPLTSPEFELRNWFPFWGLKAIK